MFMLKPLLRFYISGIDLGHYPQSKGFNYGKHQERPSIHSHFSVPAETFPDISALIANC